MLVKTHPCKHLKMKPTYYPDGEKKTGIIQCVECETLGDISFSSGHIYWRKRETMFKLVMNLNGDTCIEDLTAKTQEDAIKEAFEGFTVTKAATAFIWNVTEFNLAPMIAAKREEEQVKAAANDLEKKRAEYLRLKAIFEPNEPRSPLGVPKL